MVPLKGTQAVLPPPYQKADLSTLSNAQIRDRLRTVSGNILSDERVYKCGRHRLGSIVTISANAVGAMFGGVETCGSIWHCPVCAEKIANKRRLEVAQAIDGTKKLSGGVYLLTLTMQHAPFDKCQDLKEAVATAWRKLQNTRAWRRIKDEYQIFGTIRAIEITHGENGWHPHLHILLVAENTLSPDDLELLRFAIFEQWDKKIYDLTGKKCSPDACDLRPTNSSEYLTKGSKMKWGADHEIAKANLKRGKSGSTPFELLEYSYNGDKQATALFAEYARTFKGARHITWSRGLKEFFGINEISDEELAEKELEKRREQGELPFYENLDMRVIVAIDTGTWAAIGKYHLKPEILDVAYNKGREGVIDFLANYGLSVYLGEKSEIGLAPNNSFSSIGKVLRQSPDHKPTRMTTWNFPPTQEEEDRRTKQQLERILRSE